ncbi:hypothetical protein [Caulobacter sp. UNC279MFTsu5.1]|nr:hypothetical protein [Caulobacter sp. UNC279MFTsu5.1]SFI81105.1 hypothetical protein SAMN02799626_00565 [Caulobacter sp. UNC279MFTsu5.1]
MSPPVTRIAPAAADWFGLVETGLRVLLMAAAPVSAAIFLAQTF